jgi:hypothetical protein
MPKRGPHEDLTRAPRHHPDRRRHLRALSGTPWMLLALVTMVLTAVLGLVHHYVAWSKTRRDALLELIRTLQGR